MKEFWNQRYSAQEYIYGEEPNEFFKEQLPVPGENKKLLLPADGEGRNAVWGAINGWNADAFDWSRAAREKALKLAEKKSVSINYQVMRFEDFDAPAETYDAIGIIYIHIDSELREIFFPKLIRALKPGGILIFEAFEKEQLAYNSGGPNDAELLYNLAEVAELFIDLEFEVFTKSKIYLNEGEHHSGEAMVIRFVGVKA